MFKFERFNFEAIIPRRGGFVNTETAFFVRRRDGGGRQMCRGAARVGRHGCFRRGTSRMRKSGARKLRFMLSLYARQSRHSFFRCAAAFRMVRYPPAFGGGRVFLCRGALQKSENMIYLLHSRTSCGGDMTDFGDLPRDAVDGARYAASSPRGNARSRRSAFCGRVIFGGKI